MSSSFVDLLERLVKQHGSQRAAARVLGLSASRFNRGMQAKGYGFSVLNCFKLAEAIDEDPLVVLKAAGQGELAVRIAAVYGARKLTGVERSLLADFAVLDETDRERFTGLLRTVAKTRKR